MKLSKAQREAISAAENNDGELWRPNNGTTLWFGRFFGAIVPVRDETVKALLRRHLFVERTGFQAKQVVRLLGRGEI